MAAAKYVEMAADSAFKTRKCHHDEIKKDGECPP